MLEEREQSRLRFCAFYRPTSQEDLIKYYINFVKIYSKQRFENHASFQDKQASFQDIIEVEQVGLEHSALAQCGLPFKTRFDIQILADLLPCKNTEFCEMRLSSDLSPVKHTNASCVRVLNLVFFIEN